jgi:hypothetical protein
MKNLTAARDAVGSEEPIATGGWSFLLKKLKKLIELNRLNKAEMVTLFNVYNQSLI